MRRARSYLQKFNVGAYQACAAFTNLLLAVLVFNNLSEMVARAIWHTSLDWVFEINLLLAIWLYFAGIFQVYFRRGDISVDVVTRRMPRRIQHVLALVIDIIIVVMCTMVAWEAMRLMEVQWPFKTPGLRLPNALFTAPVVMGSVLMALTILDRFLERSVGRVAKLPASAWGPET